VAGNVPALYRPLWEGVNDFDVFMQQLPCE
jgi:hypothetical protein